QSNLEGNAPAEAAAPAAAVGGTTPLIPQWAAAENDPNPIKTYLPAVLNGKTPSPAAKQVERESNKRPAPQQSPHSERTERAGAGDSPAPARRRVCREERSRA